MILIDCCREIPGLNILDVLEAGDMFEGVGHILTVGQISSKLKEIIGSACKNCAIFQKDDSVMLSTRDLGHILSVILDDLSRKSLIFFEVHP